MQSTELKSSKLDEPDKRRGLPFMEALAMKASAREWSDRDLSLQDLLGFPKQDLRLELELPGVLCYSAVKGDDLCWVICPQGAIEITNLDSTHARLVMGREDPPFVRLLAEAEAKGRFRRLVPLDEVGWDNPVYKNPKHPRFVIEEEQNKSGVFGNMKVELNRR